MSDPKLSPTCYLDVGELADFVGGIAGADWPTALRFLKVASREIDNATHRFFFQLAAVTLDLDVLPGQNDFITSYDLLAMPTTLSADVDGDLTYSEDLTTVGVVLVPLGNATPYYGFQVRDIRIPVRGTKVLRADGLYCGWPRDSEVVSGQTVQDDPLTAVATTLTVQDATEFEVGQTLTLDDVGLGDEQVFVSNRASATTLTIERGVNGTTAAEHANDTAIYRLKWPLTLYMVAGAVAARLWRKRDTGFASALLEEGPRLPSGPVLDADDMRRLGPFIRTEIVA